jgi:hypothetical protein
MASMEIHQIAHGLLLYRYEICSNLYLQDFFGDYDNQRQYFDWLAEKLEFSSVEDWYKIKAKDVIDSGGIALLRYYGMTGGTNATYIC